MCYYYLYNVPYIDTTTATPATAIAAVTTTTTTTTKTTKTTFTHRSLYSQRKKDRYLNGNVSDNWYEYEYYWYNWYYKN